MLLSRCLLWLAPRPAWNAQRFSDVPTNAHYHDAVQWAATNGVNGCGKGKFCPNERLTRAELATMLHDFHETAFSGVGDEVTHDIALEPGYYTVSVRFFPKAGYDWDDNARHDFYARFESKSDGITLIDSDWRGDWPANAQGNNDDGAGCQCEVSNKHSDLYRSQHFRVDKAANHWFEIETTGMMAWVADVYRYASEPGSSNFGKDKAKDKDKGNSKKK